MADTQNLFKRAILRRFGTEDIGREVSVCGWVQRQRDLGNLLFIDLRDRTGMVQLAFDDKTDRGV